MNALRSTIMSGMPLAGRILNHSIARPAAILHGSQALEQQTREMSKYLSKQRRKRLPLTTKRAGKGYYKGNRCTKEGYKNSKGHFRPDPRLMLELMVPDLTDFKLKPYIAASASKYPPEERFDGPQLGR